MNSSQKRKLNQDTDSDDDSTAQRGNKQRITFEPRRGLIALADLIENPTSSGMEDQHESNGSNQRLQSLSSEQLEQPELPEQLEQSEQPEQVEQSEQVEQVEEEIESDEDSSNSSHQDNMERLYQQSPASPAIHLVDDVFHTVRNMIFNRTNASESTRHRQMWIRQQQQLENRRRFSVRATVNDSYGYQIINFLRQQQQLAVNVISSENIERYFPTIVIDGTQNFDSCTICLTDYEEEHLARRLTCTHVFHKKCIDTWLLRQLSCPVCRSTVNEMIISINRADLIRQFDEVNRSFQASQNVQTNKRDH